LNRSLPLSAPALGLCKVTCNPVVLHEILEQYWTPKWIQQAAISVTATVLFPAEFSQNSARIRINMSFRQNTGLLLLSLLCLSFPWWKGCGKASQKRLNRSGEDPTKLGLAFHLFIDISFQILYMHNSGDSGFNGYNETTTRWRVSAAIFPLSQFSYSFNWRKIRKRYLHSPEIQWKGLYW